MCLCSDSATAWTIALQTPLSMEFPRQEYWSGLPFPPPEDLPDPGMEPTSLASPALAGRFPPPKPPGKSKFDGILIHTLPSHLWQDNIQI